jgi:heterodisulfide reductase subunit A
MAEERIGVYVCSCGTNIAKMVDVAAVAEFALTIPGVVKASGYKYMCSNPGQEMIAQDIHDNGLTRIIVASCSPRMHEGTFRGAIKRAGLNPYMLEMANIREQCSWIHEDPVAATEKAKALVHAAVERVKFQEALESRTAPMCPSTMVIGGGVTGMSSALELADAGQQVFLVEKQDHLGGNVARLSLTAPYLDSAQDVLRTWISRVERHPNIRLFLNTELIELKGFNGNFKPKVKTEDGTDLELDAGSILVCTGFKEFDASKVAQYGYGKLPDVITSFELEAMLKRGKIETKSGKLPRYVSIIHCVGSRSEEFHPYCSRVCCTAGLKYAFELKSALPDVKVSNLYTDMEAFGKGCEDFYLKAGAAGTSFMMFSKHQLPTIRAAAPGDGCNMLISFKEQLSGEEIETPTDLVVLMVSMEPREDAGKVARLVNISADANGWFIESHPKLDPVATTTDGVYIAGACQFPRDIPESVTQGRAAVARILGKVAQGQITVDAVYSEVNPKLCAGCKACFSLCPYGAIEFDEKNHVSNIISAVCKACGCCSAYCPSGAIKVRHYTDEQIYAQIEGVLGS